MSSQLHAFRASFLHCLDEPTDLAHSGAAGIDHRDQAVEYIDDGLLLVEDGHIRSLEKYNPSNLPNNASRTDLSGKLVVPGFVDTHVHYPQVDVIASYGTQLLEWLETYTFPVESTFGDAGTATDTARFFLDELMRNGTTTALVFGTVHKESVDAFFTEARARKLRMVCGKVMMDRNAPDNLCDTPESSYEDSKTLIKAWHGKERLGYAVTPRFAPTSSDEQLSRAGQLLAEYPDVHMHTHLAENHSECKWVSELFPDEQDYLAVYERFNLLRKRSVFAHCLHLSNNEWQRMGEANASVAHCPTSNLFIGSGLFNLKAAKAAGVACGIGTDVGGGDSFSILRTLNEAYKVQQLQQNSLSPAQAFYMATLGGARALDLDSHIGNFEVGKEADFVALDRQASPLIARRCATTTSWQAQLFVLMMLGDDRAVFDTFVLGESVKRGLL